MGYHEREDGYLVKNEAANPAQQVQRLLLI